MAVFVRLQSPYHGQDVRVFEFRERPMQPELDRAPPGLEEDLKVFLESAPMMDSIVQDWALHGIAFQHDILFMGWEVS